MAHIILILGAENVKIAPQVTGGVFFAAEVEFWGVEYSRATKHALDPPVAHSRFSRTTKRVHNTETCQTTCQTKTPVKTLGFLRRAIPHETWRQKKKSGPTS